MAKIGVDVGGTFTDLILESEKISGSSGGVLVHKVPSTPEDQSIGVIQGIVEICDMAGVALGDIEQIVHGTTIATNAVIEYDGAEVGMLTTRGFRDILLLARGKRPHNFSMQFDVPWQSKPLVKRRNRIPISERILPPDGRVEVALDEGEVREAAELLGKRNVDAVIICFIYSFLNNAHEQRAKQIVKEILPDTYVSCSSEVADVIREYERFSTAAMNAFVGPRTSFYLGNLQKALRDKGVGAEIRVMQSNGGVTTIEGGSERPVTILMSGPAGGVTGGKWAGDLSGVENLITVDIGGTSADISVVPRGEVRIMNPRDTNIGGYPILAPMIDLATIGAGGGSIAYVDEGGAFRVGPRSAGANPGPACYGKGGTEPTVTDAQVVLGRLDAEQFLGGGVAIDPALSAKAIEDNLCGKLNMGVEQAALGIIRVINSNMALEIRANSVAKGIDPRDYSLVAFGGAGPLHGVALAETVAAREALVPPAPGINAATGLLATDMQYEFTRSALISISEADQSELDALNGQLDELVAQAGEALAADGVAPEERKFTRIAECRYQGQGFELRAEFPEGVVGGDNKQVLIDNFHESHRRDYGHAFDDQNIEIITLRVIAAAAADKLIWPKLPAGQGDNPADAVMYARPTTFDSGETLETPRYDRAKLLAGQTVTGPAIVIQHDSTTLIPPGHVAEVSEYGNLRVRATA
ncbi:MAG: hydantoinase/oxoprolinase family protein [Rhodospirillaceae bacterium]|nr:hydantoinase/oxoprolinase family protein [Rhodospirillaceae bacterium]MBT5039169.1 hydantoinase/oxoprolinase family protein [Rhodospirillaceae bacterium]MBT5674397.1 hydantoinase/oxoprolinase family protein [Rhodospirillaceae bacterium]